MNAQKTCLQTILHFTLGQIVDLRTYLSGSNSSSEDLKMRLRTEIRQYMRIVSAGFLSMAFAEQQKMPGRYNFNNHNHF